MAMARSHRRVWLYVGREFLNDRRVTNVTEQNVPLARLMVEDERFVASRVDLVDDVTSDESVAACDADLHFIPLTLFSATSMSVCSVMLSPWMTYS